MLTDKITIDDFILREMLRPDGAVNSNKCKQSYLDKHPDLKAYLDNRFEDFDNYAEVIYRIKHKIEYRPVCLHCGNRVPFINACFGFQKFCCRQCSFSPIDNFFDIEPDSLNDDLVLSIVLRKNSSGIDGNKTSQKYLSSHPKLKQYLETRFPDSQSIDETIFRMKNKIEIRPVCKECGQPVSFNGSSFSTFCSHKCSAINEERFQKQCLTNVDRYGFPCALSNNDVRLKAYQTTLSRYGNGNNFDKVKQTMLDRYGVEFPAQDPSILTKIFQTTKERHGDKFVFGTEENMSYLKASMQEKYGVDNCAQSSEIYDKIKETMTSRYGQSCPLSNGHLRDKGRETQKSKYNNMLYVQTDQFKQAISDNIDEINNKRFLTHQRNKTFNTSRIEKQFKAYLEEKFPDDFIYQFKCDRYPFMCDFYIKSLDLFIEIQGFYTHGTHPFNESDMNDIETLDKLKSKNYQNAIDVWTVRDPFKRKTAKENNLNYLEIFSCDINVCISELNKFISTHYD